MPMFRRRPMPSLHARIAQLEEAMADLSADQQHLDADVSKLADAAVQIENEVAQLKSAPVGVALDFSGLDKAVKRFTDLVPAPPAPVDPNAPVPPPAA